MKKAPIRGAGTDRVHLGRLHRIRVRAVLGMALASVVMVVAASSWGQSPPHRVPGPRHPGTQALEALYKGAKPAALEERTDLVPSLTETFVRTGVSVMPPFRKTEISDADLAALAAYLAPRAR